ncbi:MAG TPA: ion transporter, partial [Methanospirillum sp.]|nr:ion transporter [Methanospirillum sp.]
MGRVCGKHRIASFKQRVFDSVNERDEGGKPNTLFDYFIIFVIIINTILILLETYPEVSAPYKGYLDLIEQGTIIIFTIEYLLRIWTCTCYPEYRHPVLGRLRYACSITMIIDFFAVFPFYLTLLMPLSVELVHFLRLFRLFRVMKLLRYYGSIDVIYRVIKRDSQYLFSVSVILLVFLSFSSYLIYILESEAQPDRIHDFDDALWWAIETTSTVGYGDVVPVTGMGKFFSFLIILIGIGLIA